MKTNWTDSNCIFHQCSLAGKKKPVSFKKVFGKVVKILISLNVYPWVQDFLIFSVMKWKEHSKHFCSLPKVDGCLKEKHSCWLRCELSWPLLFKDLYFSLKKWWTDSVFKAVYFADIVLTIEERSLWLQGKQPKILTVNNKMNTFKQQWLDCPDKPSGNVEKCDFWMLYNEVCKGLKIWKTICFSTWFYIVVDE